MQHPESPDVGRLVAQQDKQAALKRVKAPGFDVVEQRIDFCRVKSSQNHTIGPVPLLVAQQAVLERV